MGLLLKEKAELEAYQLKGVVQVWYNQMKERKVKEVPIGLEDFNVIFLDYFFPLELREAKVLDFINLKQVYMSVSDYALKFMKLCKYFPTLVTQPRAHLSKFFPGISNLAVKECKTTMLIKEIYIPKLIMYTKNIKEEKIREKRVRVFKRAQQIVVLLLSMLWFLGKKMKGTISHLSKV